MSFSSLFGLLNFQQIWLAIPLGLAFSLVYAGTRHEESRYIFARAARVAAWLFFFVALLGAILYFIV